MENPSNVVRRELLVLDSRYWTPLTGFSADPMPEVPPRVDLVHELSSVHSVDVCIGRILRSAVQHTEKYSGCSDAEISSLNRG